MGCKGSTQGSRPDEDSAQNVRAQKQVLDLSHLVPPELTKEQIMKIQTQWATFFHDPQLPRYSVLVFARLFELYPDTYPLFFFVDSLIPADLQDNTRLQSHAQRVLDALNLGITSLNNFTPIIKVLHNLGGRHVNYGVKVRQIPGIIPAVLYVLEQVLSADEFNKESKQLWEDVLTFFVDVICDGFNHPQTKA